MGKFVLGFVIGTAIGAGAALVLTSRPQSEENVAGSIQANVRQILSEAKRAAVQRERELWQDFYKRVPQLNRTDQA